MSIWLQRYDPLQTSRVFVLWEAAHGGMVMACAAIFGVLHIAWIPILKDVSQS